MLFEDHLIRFCCFNSNCHWCLVDGLLSAVETRCMVTGSPAAVVAAVTLGGKLRTLLSAESVTETHSVLTAELRVRMIVYTFDIYLTASPLGVWSIAVSMFVCMSVQCLLAYLKNRMSILHKIICPCYLFSSDDNAICYVLLVLWMTSCFHIMGQIQAQTWSLWHVELFTVTCKVVPPNCTLGGKVCHPQLPCYFYWVCWMADVKHLLCFPQESVNEWRKDEAERVIPCWMSKRVSGHINVQKGIWPR